MLKNPNVVAVKNSSMPTQDIQMVKDAGIAARGAVSYTHLDVYKRQSHRSSLVYICDQEPPNRTSA